MLFLIFIPPQCCCELTESLRKQSYFRVPPWSIRKNVPLTKENCFSSAWVMTLLVCTEQKISSFSGLTGIRGRIQPAKTHMWKLNMVIGLHSHFLPITQASAAWCISVPTPFLLLCISLCCDSFWIVRYPSVDTASKILDSTSYK